MVKLRHPIMSNAAGGSLANAVTFSKTGRSAYIKKKPTPKQPRTGNQISMRAMMRFLVTQWPLVPPAQIPNWENAYPRTKTNAYNAWIKFNLTAWRNHLTPSHIYPPNRSQAQTNGIILTATNGVRHVHLEAVNTPVPGSARWGLLFHSNVGPPTADFDNLVHVFWTKALDATTWIHSPLPNGTHYYRIVSASGAGACNWTIFDTDTAVVT